MINEISPQRFNNTFSNPNEINDKDFVFCFKQDSLMLKMKGEEVELPRKKDISSITDLTKRTFLFTIDSVSCFLIWDFPVLDEKQFVFKNIHFFRTFEHKEIAWGCIVSFQLMNWYAQNRFCGKCGSATVEKPDERAVICPNCSHTVYPKISPAIIVAIVSGENILLASNSNFRSNWFSLVAGYADIGESLEETVIREVKEEVGIDVRNIRYYKSQPWPFSGSMMIGFIAEADSKQKIQVDNSEITEAKWFTRSNLPNHPSALSISGELIELFEKGKI
jgi:NAD+ diphosphatase